MSTTIAFSPNKYYKDAQTSLEKKDLLEFVAKVSIAVESSSSDQEMLAKATFLKAKGLMNFNQHSKAVDSIEEAIKYNVGLEAFELKKLKGIAKGYLGSVSEAITTFKELLTEAKDNIMLVRICVNLAWVYLTLDKENHDKGSLVEAEKYLELANQHFDVLPDLLKRKVLNNYSVYYFYKGEYEKSITVLNEAFKYAEEKDFPKLYNNLAEVLIKYDEGSDTESSSIIEYLDKSEMIASKFDDKIELAFSLYARAKLEVQEEQIFSALDTLYLAFNYFTEAEAYSYSLECLFKINELVNDYKAECMRTMQKKLHNKVKSNPYYEKKLKK